MVGFKRMMELIATRPALVAKLYDAGALNDAETALFHELCENLTTQLSRAYGWSEAEAVQMVHHYEGLLGARGLLRRIAEPPIILGMPKDYFLINLMATFFVLSVTQLWISVPISLVLLHVAGVFVYLIRRPVVIRHHIATIRSKGIKV